MSALMLGLHRVCKLTALFALIVLLAPFAAAQEQAKPVPTVPSAASPADPSAPQVAATLPVEEKFSDAQLDQLVAPIALHPDLLLAQILTAATYPLEVEMAARWAKANPSLKGKQLEEAMQRQTWDPSVKSLTAVPQVLQMMSDKLDWTKQIGDAYLAQPDEITQAIQRLRVKAADAGNLKTTKEQKVTRVSGPPPAELTPGPGVAPAMAADLDYIAIEPVDPEVIFVPVYNPLLVYGLWPDPLFPPFFWYPPGYVAVGVFAFSAPCFVGPALWARWDWRARRIGVFVPHYNSFNRARWAANGINPNWRHNPIHRGNIAYGNAALQQRFGRAGINGNPVDRAARQNAFRSNLQQNNPGIGRQGLTGNFNQNNPGAGRQGLTGNNRQNNPGVGRQGLTGNVTSNNGVPRTSLNPNQNLGLRQNAIGTRSAAINGNVNRGTMVNRNINVHQNTNIQRNMNVPRSMNVPHGGGMPRAMGGGMPMGRPMMASPGAARAVAAPGHAAAGIRR